MSEIFSIRSFSVNDFNQWRGSEDLELSPKFQRRKVWSGKAKSYLIDTILKGLPIPPVFLRERIDLSTRKTIREVIDGQQRLAAIFDFLDDGFRILKTHNEEFGNLNFSQLSEEVKIKFLSYQIPTHVLTTAEDAKVLEIFARLNTYTVPLNKTEILNAKYFGLFKQLVHMLAREYYKFWEKSEILGEGKIVRMVDVELTSELVIASIDGIKDKKEIERYYKMYDDSFERKQEIQENFINCMDTIDIIYGEILPRSYFKGIPLFYSLYCLMYDLLYGLRGSDNERRIPKSDYPKIRNVLQELESVLEVNEKTGRSIPENSDIIEFINDYKRHTTNESVRKRRHKFLINFVNQYL